MASAAGGVLLPSAALFLFLLSSSAPTWAAAQGAKGTPFHVGVILDRGSSLNGNVSWTCISMAVDDFYAAHPESRARVVLHLRDSGEDTMGAAAAALDLLKNVQVQAMVGPMRSAQAKFVMELGNRSQVPVISFSAKSPSLSSSSTEYFVRTAMNDKSQAKAIAAIVQAFRWREVVPIFEDTEYGRGIVPDLIDELGEVDALVPYRSVIPLTATNSQILSELYKLKAMQTRIFVVHTTCKLGFQLFSMAKEARMMETGYVWITTYGLTDLPDMMGPYATDVMQGVLGVKPHVQETKRLKDFKVRWRRKFYLENPFNTELNEPTVFGLWAYDTVWALAMAAERIRTTNFAYQNVSKNSSSTDFEALGLSPIGSELLSLILNTEFDGLSGRFHLVSEQLDNTAIEIVNVIDNGKRRIGFWTASQGVSRHLNSKADLKIVIWPGKSTSVPKGWEWPTSGKKLQIGVPVKPGFNEFTDLNRGFCIQVFNAVMKALPYAVPFDYVPYADGHGKSNGTYDDLVYQVYLKVFPKGSPLVPDVSRAILKVTEGELFEKFQKELYEEHQCPDQSNSIASSSLGLDSFWGLFLITGVASTVAFIICLVFFFYENRHVFGTLSSDSSVLQKLQSLIRLYDQKDPSSHAFKNDEDRQMMGTELAVGLPYCVNQPRSPFKYLKPDIRKF